MKTVLFVYSAHDTAKSGGPLMLGRLLSNIDRTRFRPVVLVQHEDQWVTGFLRRSNVETVSTPTPASLNVFGGGLLRGNPLRAVSRLRAYTGYLSQVRRALLQVKPDIVWCINLRALLTTAVPARLSRIPVIWQIGLGLVSKGRNRYVNDLALALSSAVFIESATQVSRLFSDVQRRRHQGKFMILPKGVEVDKFERSVWMSQAQRPQGVPNEAFLVGAVGSLIPRKGYEVLLETLTQLSVNARPVHLAIIGGDPSQGQEYKQKLQGQIERLGLSDRVHLLGTRDDVPKWLAGMDLFVLPSYGEGISGALREAMAMSLPVVATDVGGTPDLVRHGYNGLLVPPGDPASLSSAIEALAQDPERAREFGRRARQTMEEVFSVRAHVHRYEAAFEALLATTEGGDPAERLARRLQVSGGGEGANA